MQTGRCHGSRYHIEEYVFIAQRLISYPRNADELTKKETQTINSATLHLTHQPNSKSSDNEDEQKVGKKLAMHICVKPL